MIFVILHNKQMVLINDSLMKRIFFLAVALFVAAIGANAQDNETPKDEIALSWSYGTFPHIIEGISDVFVDLSSGGSVSTNSIGAIGVGYMHNFNDVVGLGAVASYEYIYSKNSETSTKHGENYLTVMPTLKASWHRRSGYSLYSRVALGAALEMYDANGESKSETQFAFQLTPIALQVGKGKIHGFFELGFGYQGILTAGVSFGL